MKIEKIFKYSCIAVLIAGCSSSPKTELEKISDNHVGEERVVARIDEMKSRPDWVREETPFSVEGGKVLSLGMTTVPADHNISAAYRIAENNAKASISHAIEQRFDFVFQNAEEGTVMGASQARYIGAEASKLTTSSLRLSKRYWEKVAVVESSGAVTLQYRVFALSEMPETDFKAAVLDVVRRSQGKQGISAEFAKKVDKHWNEFVAGGNAPEARVPSAQSEQ